MSIINSNEIISSRVNSKEIIKENKKLTCR